MRKYIPYPVSRSAVALSPRYSPRIPCCLKIPIATLHADASDGSLPSTFCCRILINSVGLAISLPNTSFTLHTWSTLPYDVTIPHPTPASPTCVNDGTDAGSSSCALMNSLYDENTSPFMNAHVAYMYVVSLGHRPHAESAYQRRHDTLVKPHEPFFPNDRAKCMQRGFIFGIDTRVLKTSLDCE